MSVSQASGQIVNPFAKVEILASSFGAKFGTKGEIYRFLTTEALIYLPSYDQVTIWHMKDLTSNEKTVSRQVLC